MIVRVAAKNLKSAVEFVQAGMGVDMQSQWLRLMGNKETGSLYLSVIGLTEYQAVIKATVIREGVVWVGGKVLAELVGKLKNDFLKGNCNLMIQDSKFLVMTNGEESGYKYNLPLNLLEMPNSFTGPELAIIDMNSSQLLDVIAGMKAIREAESDHDVPACEVIQTGRERLQFVAVTRLRSVSCWLDTECRVMYPNGIMQIYLAIEHLQKMEKAMKVAGKELKKGEEPIPVEFRVWSNVVEFRFSGGGMESCVIRLRRLEKEPSKINHLISVIMRPEMIRATLLMDGDKLKQAYDRLDAFGKRNETAQHRIEFELVGNELKMQAGGVGVGYGRESILVEGVAKNTGDPILFAAAGNKLADLLRISKFGKVKLIIGRRNIMLSWVNSELRVENLAILAGMQVASAGGEA